MWRQQCEDITCGEMQYEGAFEEGYARVSCTESSISRKKLTSGDMWKVRATIALPAKKYVAFQYMIIVVKESSFQYMANEKKTSHFISLGCCSGNILLFS